MDGWAVLTYLKADPATAGIPVLMSTAVDERNMGFAFGAADYLIGPIDRSRVTDALRRYGNERLGRRALVIDDEPAERQLLRQWLEQDAWTVDEAENGRVALERLGGRTPSIIFLDLVMPYMDGFQFAAEVWTHPEWRAIPIVVITGKDLTPDDHARLNGHVEHVLQKGLYSREELFREIQHFLWSRLKPPGALELNAARP
jgi:CheY-like chemotaxis protein